MRITIISLVALLTLNACGAIAERASEEFIEQVVESSGEDIGDVDIDFDDDGSVTIESEEGSVSVGANVEIPDSLSVPVPSGAVAVVAFSDGATTSLSLTSDQGFDEVVEFYEDWASSFDPPLETSFMEYTTDDGAIKTMTWLDGPGTVSVTAAICFSVDTGELDDVCITIFEMPEG